MMGRVEQNPHQKRSMKKSSRWINFCLLAVATTLLHGCVLHPEYERPCVDAPDHWRISMDESCEHANYRWWEQFQDPVLDALVAEALESNQDLKVAIARVFAFSGQLQIARSGLYPQISATGEAFRQESSIALIPLSPGVKRTSDVYSAIFNGSYDLDIWGKIRSGAEASLAQLMGSVETRRTVVLGVVSGVAASYFLLRQYDEELRISKDTFQSRVESFDLANLRFKEGLTSELEPKQSEALMEEAAQQVIGFELAIAEQENLLSVLVGHPPRAIQRGVVLENFPVPQNVPVGLPSQILDQRPDILAAEDNLISANAEIGVARAQFFPDISLTGFYGNQSVSLSNLITAPARAWEFGATLMQPIFTGWLLTGQLNVAEGQKYEAYYAYQQTVLTAFKEVSDALVAFQKTKELVVVLKKREAALVQVLHLSLLRYNNGEVDYLNVLDAQRFLFEAQLDRAQAQGNVLISLVEIYKSLGGGWVIEADNTALEPPCPSP